MTRCGCEDCAELSKFLLDPHTRQFTYGVRKDRRRHLRHQVQAEQLDVDTREVKTGSPHKIVFAKTNCRHERAVERHRAHLRALEDLADPG